MEKMVKLQGICEKQQGTKVKDLKVGDILIWNYGMKSQVVELIPSISKKTYVIKEKSLQDGIIRDRKTTAERLVVVEKHELEIKEEKIVADPIQKAIDERERTHYSIYSDIGTALEKFTTIELAEFYINICGSDSALRYYIEQEIIAHEIEKEKTA